MVNMAKVWRSFAAAEKPARADYLVNRAVLIVLAPIRAFHARLALGYCASAFFD